MAWHWIGDKQLPEPMMTQLADPYMGRDHFMNAAIERPRYIVTSSLIGWAYSQNNPYMCHLTTRNWSNLHTIPIEYIYTMTSDENLKSPVNWLFIQQLVQVTNKEKIKIHIKTFSVEKMHLQNAGHFVQTALTHLPLNKMVAIS